MSMLQLQTLPICRDEIKEDSSDLITPDKIWAYEAHFSEKPPPVPIRIAFIGQTIRHQVHPERVQRLFETIKEIEMYSKNTSNENIKLPEMTAYGQHYSVPIRRSTSQSKQISTYILGAHETKPCRAKHSSSKRLARLLLTDLLSKLPLPLEATGKSYYRRSRSPAKVKSVSLTPMKKSDVSVLRRQSSPTIIIHCNIATQAEPETLQSMTDCSNPSGRSTQDFTDDWIGGVRALRDSHVKLVLRELRHIDRLNRTLDRATKNRLR